MKNAILIFFSNAFFSVCFSQCQKYGPLYLVDEFYCNENGYTLVFEDEFEDNKVSTMDWLNGTYGWSNTLINNNEAQIYRSDNQIMEDGKIKLFAQNEYVQAKVHDWLPESAILADGGQNLRGFNYTSGALRSKKQFGYGKYEIKCQIPKGKGFWPAFWTYNGGLGPFGNAYCEIDIFEFWNENNFWGNYDPNLLAKEINTNIHHNFLQQSNPTANYQCSDDFNLGIDFSVGYHTFAVVYDELEIKYYADNILLKTIPLLWKNNLTYTTPIDCYSYDLNNQGYGYYMNMAYPKFPGAYILANLAIQSEAQNLPDQTNPLTDQFEIEYIRFYKKTPCVQDLVVTTNQSLNLSYDLYNYVNGDKVTLKDNIIIDGQWFPNGVYKEGQLKVAAKSEINLKPGFWVKNTSGFVGIIDNSLNDCFSGISEPSPTANRESINLTVNDKSALEILNLELPINPEVKADFTIFPNPALNEFTISVENLQHQKSKSYSISVFDLNGRKLLETRLNNAIELISIEMLEIGSYIIELNNLDDNTKQSKILVKE